MRKLILIFIILCLVLLSVLTCLIFTRYHVKIEKIGDRKSYFPKGALSYSTDWDRDDKKYFEKEFIALQEPSMYELSNNVEEISYRFYYSFSKAPDPIVVRISLSKEKESGKLYLIKGQYSKYNEQNPMAERQLSIREKREIDLSQKEVLELYAKLNDIRFWSIEGPSDRLGCDGSMWLFEGVEKGKYKAIKRWSPEEKQLRELGEQFIKLSGLDYKLR